MAKRKTDPYSIWHSAPMPVIGREALATAARVALAGFTATMSYEVHEILSHLHYKGQ